MKGKKSDVRRFCWSGRGLILEVDVMGRRRVSWDRKKGGDTKISGESRVVEWECKKEASKALKWVSRGTKQAEDKPVMGLGTSPVLTDTRVGPFISVFSGPSLFEVGESSLTGEGNSAHVSMIVACPKALPQIFDLEPEVLD